MVVAGFPGKVSAVSKFSRKFFRLHNGSRGAKQKSFRLFKIICFTFNNITRFDTFRQYAFCINLLRFSRDFITFAQVCLFYADLRGILFNKFCTDFLLIFNKNAVLP